MSDVQIDMDEVFDLARQLDLRSVTVATEAAVAVKHAAERTRDLAREMAPVRTGALRDSIRMTGSRLTRNVKANIRYSAYVEFGTTDTPPQPFLYPASDRGEEMLLTELAEIASQGL